MLEYLLKQLWDEKTLFDYLKYNYIKFTFFSSYNNCMLLRIWLDYKWVLFNVRQINNKIKLNFRNSGSYNYNLYNTNKVIYKYVDKYKIE
jgi:hypothetical protein